ncbi:MAG TPA: radical SAM protein [Terriglobales bacterium]|nr:radical SAM protein [Terriglobales bacterium]
MSAAWELGGWWARARQPGSVYASTLRFFLAKTARQFRPAWMRVVPNLMLHQGVRWLEETRLIAPRLRHRLLRPISIGLQLTRHCNYRCEFCTVNGLISDGDGAGALSLAEFEQLLQRPLLSRCARLGFTGGEPLLAPDFFAIVRAAKRRIPIVTLNTNFSLIKLHLDALNASELDMINISLYQPNQHLVRRYAAQLSSRMYRRLSFVVNEREPFHHYRRIGEVAQLAVEAGFQALYLQNYLAPSPLLDRDSPRASRAAALQPVRRDDREYAEIRRQVEARYGRQLAIAWPVFAREAAPVRRACRQPDTQILVDREGALAPCCILDADSRFGSAHHGEGWNSDELAAIRRGLKDPQAALADACRDCPFVETDMYDA